MQSGNDFIRFQTTPFKVNVNCAQEGAECGAISWINVEKDMQGTIACPNKATDCLGSNLSSAPSWGVALLNLSFLMCKCIR